jgi:multisubunit Na+/H+ antiporter MnhC subunit
MADETQSLKMARPMLGIGAVVHVTGLFVYDPFPFLYLISILLLCCSYYLFLKGSGYRPLATPAFWGMAIVLAIPIVGLLAGVQKILFIPKKGDMQSNSNRLMSSQVSLTIFIPMIAVFAALSLPAFPDAPAGLMTGILICAAVIEVILIAVILHARRKS